MASIGKASLTIVPKFDNLGKSVTAALDRVDPSRSGEKMGKGLAAGVERGAGGLVKTGAIMGVFSAATAKAMDVVSSSVGGAVSRLDTLNNYPRVMQALGYSAEESQASIAKMSDRLTGLPTALNDMTSTVQGISAITGDLGKATDAGLALNDMLLASGSNTQVTTAAMEQFRQMLSKGEPEMQDWKSLLSAMPGQMNQLAKSMLGPTATANDLYAALGGGKNEAVLSMDDLMNAMIRLDTEGGEGITSFAEQARNATGGVQSGMANMQTAIERGMASVLDSIGSDTISSFAKDVGGAFENALKAAGDGIVEFKPLATDLYAEFSKAGNSVASVAGKIGKAVVEAEPQIRGLAKSLADAAPKLLTTAAGFVAFRAAGVHLASFVSKAKDASKASSMLEGANRLLGTSFSPLSVGITAASGVLAAVVTEYLAAKKKSDDLRTATSGLRDTMGRLSTMTDEAGESFEGYSGYCSNAAGKSEAFIQKLIDFKTSLEEIYTEANTSAASLEAYRQTIEELGGRSNLSESQVGLLRTAIQGVNDACGESYAVAETQNGAYQIIKDGAVVAKDAVLDLISAQQMQYQYDAATKGWEEGYKDVAAGAAAVAAAQADVNYVTDRYKQARQDLMDQGYSDEDADLATQSYRDTIADLNDKLQVQLDLYHAHESTLDLLKDKQAIYSEAINDGASTMADLVVGNDLMVAAFDKNAQHGTQFVDILNSLGVSAEELGTKTPEQLGAMASSFDGSVGSIIGKLDELGVHYDASSLDLQQMAGLSEEQWRQMAEAAGISFDELIAKAEEAGIETPVAAQKIADALHGMGEDVETAVVGIGTNVDDMSEKLKNAGVASSDLSGIAQDDFAAMVVGCGGDIAKLADMIQFYNSQPVADKDGAINVESATLSDAQGKLYTWNGEVIADKYGTAALDDQELVDAQGNLWLWNGSMLEFKGGQATVDDNGVLVATEDVAIYNGQPIELHSESALVDASSVQNANSYIREYNNNPPKEHRATTVIDVIQNVWKNVFGGSENAAGGIRLNAAGGYRFHGAGAIATKAMPLDIVGEDGAEAIVPLTNKRYSLPFAKTLAEQIGVAGGGLTKADVYDAVSAALSSASNREVAVYVDGRKLASEMAVRMDSEFGRLQSRRGR